MSSQERTSNSRMNDAVGIMVLIILLVMFPAGIGYMSTFIFRFPVWSGIIIGLASSFVILVSLVFLLGATVRFPDHCNYSGEL